jgi:hypothetical protein
MVWSMILAILVSVGLTTLLIRQENQKKARFRRRPLRRRLKGPSKNTGLFRVT